jgi:membrane protein
MVTDGRGDAIAEAGLVRAVPTAASVWNRVRAFLLALIRALREVNLTALSAQVAYSLIFAMPSILLIIALVARAVDQRTGFAISEEVRLFIIGTLPPGVQPLVTSLIDDAILRAREGPSTISAIISILVALLAAGNGLGDLANAFDRAAGIDDPRPAWQKRFIFTASAILIATVLLVAFALYVWGGDLVILLTQRLQVPGDWVSGWHALQGPVIVVLVFLGTTLLYMTSSGRYSFRLTAVGAAVATLIWFLVVKGFQIYLQIANPATAYGAASSVLVFLVFLYLTSMGLIVGAMSAAVIVRQARGERKPSLSAGLVRKVRHHTALHPGLEPPGADPRHG